MKIPDVDAATLFQYSVLFLSASSADSEKFLPKDCSKQLLNGNHKISDTKGAIPIVFTIPPMAAVGVLEETAKKQGLRFRTNYEDDTSSWYSSCRVGERFSSVKVLIEEGRDHILGIHIVGPHAEEQINIFALVIQRELLQKILRR